MRGRVQAIESMGAVDGPGLRCVVFMQGCPMRCLYCHNPETWAADGGAAMDAAEVVARVRRFAPYFGARGGVTLSGGEPLMQAAFAREILAGCKAAGIHTAVDTCGHFLNDAVRQCLELTDLVLLDVKHTDPARHRKLTGHGNERVHRFLGYLVESRKAVMVRQVIVPSWNDAVADIRALARMLTDVPELAGVELLPYHDAVWKWRAVKRPYALAGLSPPTAARMEELRQTLSAELECRVA